VNLGALDIATLEWMMIAVFVVAVVLIEVLFWKRRDR